MNQEQAFSTCMLLRNMDITIRKSNYTNLFLGIRDRKGLEQSATVIHTVIPFQYVPFSL
jgi:hypothetical protein